MHRNKLSHKHIEYMDSSIKYKPFFWNDMVEGLHSGGYKVTNNNLNNDVTSNKVGGNSTDNINYERFQNLVVPIGLVILNEKSPFKKYTENTSIDTIDDKVFDKLFDSLTVNPASKNKNTRKHKKNAN